MISTKRDEAKALVAQQPTHALTAGLAALATPRDEAETLARAWIIDALEERYPLASAAVQSVFDANEAAMIAGEEPAEVDYAAVLLAAVETVTRPVSYASLNVGRSFHNTHTDENATITGTANGDVVMELTSGTDAGESITLRPHEVCQNWVNLP
jgi:hypothetical protein